MKVKYINNLQNKNVLEEKFSSIPEENFVQFFNEISGLLVQDATIKRLEIELARAVTNDLTITFSVYTKDRYDWVRFSVAGILWNTVFCSEEIEEKWKD